MKDLNLVPAPGMADILGRPVRSIYDAIYRGGDLPLVTPIGRRLYFQQADIDDWFAEKRAEALAKRTERQQALVRPFDRTRPSNSNRTVKSRGPRAGKQSGPSLNTAGSNGVCYE